MSIRSKACECYGADFAYAVGTGNPDFIQWGLVRVAVTAEMDPRGTLVRKFTVLKLFRILFLGTYLEAIDPERWRAAS